MTPRKTRLQSWYEGAPLPSCGEYLKTDAGSVYLVIACRTTRPGSKSLAVLDILRLAPDEIADMPTDAIVWGFAWCSRK